MQIFLSVHQEQLKGLHCDNSFAKTLLCSVAVARNCQQFSGTNVSWTVKNLSTKSVGPQEVTAPFNSSGEVLSNFFLLEDFQEYEVSVRLENGSSSFGAISGNFTTKAAKRKIT